MPKKNPKKILNSNKDWETLLHRLKQQCDGLFYISETDAPVTPFVGSSAGRVKRDVILQQTSADNHGPIVEVPFDDFFARLTEEKEWFGEREKERAKKFLDLKTLIEENLRNIKVFRVGNIRINIYVVGINGDGQAMGVETQAVET